MSKVNPNDVIRDLAEQAEGQLQPDQEFLKNLQKLTGQPSIQAMIDRFKVLAGITKR